MKRKKFDIKEFLFQNFGSHPFTQTLKIASLSIFQTSRMSYKLKKALSWLVNISKTFLNLFSIEDKKLIFRLPKNFWSKFLTPVNHQ